MHHRAFVLAMLIVAGCGAPGAGMAGDDDHGPGHPGTLPDASTDGGGTPTPRMFVITLVPDGASGMQTVNFAIPFAPGVMFDQGAIKLRADGVELRAARRPLARYPDGSVRSVQMQTALDVTAHHAILVEIGAVGATGPELVPVQTTLTGVGANIHPRVWAVLPSDVLVASGFAGPVTARAAIANTPLDAWSRICDYDKWDTDAFLMNASASREVWLYDRVTAMVRGYAITGDLSPLRSAYREAQIYRNGMTIANGMTTGVAVPDANTDLRYFYSQGMALHYLLTGDDRFRDAAEAVSAKIETMWNPQYDGADRFWTERHAGFTLLAHEWALAVTDDQADAIAARSEVAVTAFLSDQATYPASYTDANARCFAHSATAHGEMYGTDGCSPWMSALLADALDAYARRVGGSRAMQVRTSIARLGRLFAREGRDPTGKPFAWIGLGAQADVTDDTDEHWGETAYVIAMAWDASGRTEAGLRQAAESLINGLRTHGSAGQVRSFNWQCRSAVMTPTYLR